MEKLTYCLNRQGNCIIYQGDGTRCQKIPGIYFLYSINESKPINQFHPTGIILKIEDAEKLNIPCADDKTTHYISPKSLTELIAHEMYYSVNVVLCLLELESNNPEQYQAIVQAFQLMKETREKIKDGK
ncbi:MAG: hypothetical protein JXB88_10495 [Spirochaetales bacterium]|nr:hypothetical protein [Spirochaetales bacterium]